MGHRTTGRRDRRGRRVAAPLACARRDARRPRPRRRRGVRARSSACSPESATCPVLRTGSRVGRGCCAPGERRRASRCRPEPLTGGMPPPYVHCVATTPIDLDPTRRQGTRSRHSGTVGLHRHRTRLDGAGLLPRRDARLRRAGGRRAGADRVRHRVHPDAVHRVRLPGAQQRGPRLRHDVHVGHEGLRPVGRLDGRLGRRRRGHGRARQPRPDRRHLLLGADRRHLHIRGRAAGRQRAARDGDRRRLHRR